jgi:CubicO group peptidase (beta-lactamase class C family)
MPFPDGYLDAVADTIRQILQIAGVAQAGVFVEKYDRNPERRTSQPRDFHENGRDEHGDNGEDEGTVIYAIGSLTKLLIAVLMLIIVDKLSCSKEPKHEPYRRLRRWNRDPWDIPFTTIFNHFSDNKMSSLPKNPKLRHVLLHYNSLPPMNFALLAPDGTSLMSIKDFLKVAPRLTEAAYGTRVENYIEYSNGNYILIGLLIEAIAPQNTIQELMAEYIFKPLGMTCTYMGRPDRDNIPYARPYVVTTLGRRELSGRSAYQADAIVNPAMAAYSCTRDIAILLRELVRALDDEVSIFEKDLVLRLLQPEGKYNETDSDRQTLCGINTTLDTSTLGSKSINRLVTPTKVCSTYRLGVKHGNEVPAYYMTGSVNGYASCLYLMPKHSTFVIVLTNTSGRTDASDHISRFILQDIFDLERTPHVLASLATKSFLDKTLDVRSSDSKAKVDIIDMASRAAQEGQDLLMEWERADALEDVPDTELPQLAGTYHNELTKQSILIRPHDHSLIVNIKGGAGTSTDIGLHRTGASTFRLYPLNEDGFTIDRYDHNGWKELSFEIIVEKDKDGNQRVVEIKRHGAPIPPASIYKRISESSGNFG